MASEADRTLPAGAVTLARTSRPASDRFALWVPEIEKEILNGRQPEGIQLEELTRVMPSEWGKQRQHLVWR